MNRRSWLSRVGSTYPTHVPLSFPSYAYPVPEHEFSLSGHTPYSEVDGLFREFLAEEIRRDTRSIFATRRSSLKHVTVDLEGDVN